MVVFVPIKRMKHFLQEKEGAGFTLLELMIVIAIIGILAAIAIPNYLSYREKARYAAAISDLHAISLAADNFFLNNGRYPINLGEIGMANTRDPWGHPYQYLSIATVHGVGPLRKDRNVVPVNTDYDLYSMGADGRSVPPFTAPMSQDDIVRANDGAYWGYVKDY